jgi:hypothetical protein
MVEPMVGIPEKKTAVEDETMPLAEDDNKLRKDEKAKAIKSKLSINIKKDQQDKIDLNGRNDKMGTPDKNDKIDLLDMNDKTDLSDKTDQADRKGRTDQTDRKNNKALSVMNVRSVMNVMIKSIIIDKMNAKTGKQANLVRNLMISITNHMILIHMIM